MRASGIRTETYPREEQSLSPKIRATKLAWISLYSSLSIKQQFDRIEASAGGALAGFQGDAGIEVLRRVKSRQCLQHTETVVALISIELFHLNSTLLTSETRRKQPKPRLPRKLCHSRLYCHLLALCSCVYAVALSAFVQLYKHPFRNQTISGSRDSSFVLSHLFTFIHLYLRLRSGPFLLGGRCASAAGITHRVQ